MGISIYRYRTDGWRAFVTFDNKRRNKAFPKCNKIVAQNWASKEFSRMQKNEPEPDNITVAELLDWYLENYAITCLAGDGYKNKIGIVKKIKAEKFSQLRVVDLDVTHINKWRKRLLFNKDNNSPNLADSTVRHYMTTLHTAIKEYKGDVNPALPDIMKGITKPKAYKLAREYEITKQQEEQILKAIECEHDKLAVMLAFVTGMRLQEIVFTDWNAIDYEKGRVQVRGELSKTPVHRIIEIPAYLLMMLQFHVGKHQKFYPKTQQSLSRNFKAACRKVNLPHLQFRDTRHTALTRIYDATKDVFGLLQISGHKNIRMLEKYIVPKDIMKNADNPEYQHTEVAPSNRTVM
jgi:integrase